MQYYLIAGVELENESDIIKYIQNRPKSTQISEGLDLYTAMRAKNIGQSQGNYSTGHLGGPKFALQK